MSGHSVGHLTVAAVPAFAPSTVVALETGTSPTVSPSPEILSSVESVVPPAQSGETLSPPVQSVFACLMKIELKRSRFFTVGPALRKVTSEESRRAFVARSRYVVILPRRVPRFRAWQPPSKLTLPL